MAVLWVGMLVILLVVWRVALKVLLTVGKKVGKKVDEMVVQTGFSKVESKVLYSGWMTGTYWDALTAVKMAALWVAVKVGLSVVN